MILSTLAYHVQTCLQVVTNFGMLFLKSSKYVYTSIWCVHRYTYTYMDLCTAIAGELHACVWSINIQDDKSVNQVVEPEEDVHCHLQTRGVGKCEVLGSGPLLSTVPISSPCHFTPLSRTASRWLTLALSFCSFSSCLEQPQQVMVNSPGGKTAAASA